MLVERIGDDEFVLISGEKRITMNFFQLADLKDKVDQMYSDEQSRILMESLTGDYVCDGCMI